MQFAIIFSHSRGWLFTLLVTFLDVKFQSLTKSPLSIFNLFPVLLVSNSRNHCYIQCSDTFSLCFLLGVLMAFRSLIHFELILTHSMLYTSNFILLRLDIHFSQDISWRDNLFPTALSRHLCWKSSLHIFQGSCLGALFCSSDPHTFLVCIVLLSVSLS